MPCAPSRDGRCLCFFATRRSPKAPRKDRKRSRGVPWTASPKMTRSCADNKSISPSLLLLDRGRPPQTILLVAARAVCPAAQSETEIAQRPHVGHETEETYASARAARSTTARSSGTASRAQPSPPSVASRTAAASNAARASSTRRSARAQGLPRERHPRLRHGERHRKPVTAMIQRHRNYESAARPARRASMMRPSGA